VEVIVHQAMRLHLARRLGARLSEHGGETPAEVWLLNYSLRPGPSQVYSRSLNGYLIAVRNEILKRAMRAGPPAGG